MKNREKRHQVEERGEFTEQQKTAIAAKSDDRCAWCGKKVYFGYGATVDHFIPLKKGGTNDFANLVMMCKECNQKKTSKLIPVNVAAKYLNKKPLSNLEDYVSDYLHTYDYISRGNLMAFDMYEIGFIPDMLAAAHRKAVKKNKKSKINIESEAFKYLLCRAYPDDEDRLTSYFIKYLKKYKCLHSEEAARQNIRFWMRFGSIYYIENNGEISVVSCVTVNRNGYITFNIFSYYSTDLAISMSRGIVTALSDAIMDENSLAYLPICVTLLKGDTLSYNLLYYDKCNVVDDRFLCQTYFTFNDKISLPKDENTDEFVTLVTRFRDFITRFKDIEDSIQLYLYENDLMDYSWMADEILERPFFSEDYYVSVK